MGKYKVAKMIPSEELQAEIEVLKTIQQDFNQRCANLENNLLKRVFRVVLGKKKLVLSDYKKFRLVSLEGQPNRYNVFLKCGNILLGEVTKTFSDTKGFVCSFEPNKPKDEEIKQN